MATFGEWVRKLFGEDKRPSPSPERAPPSPALGVPSEPPRRSGRPAGPPLSATAPLPRRTVLSDPDLRSLPDDMQVDGDLELQNGPRLEGLPTGLRVSGDLVIRGCARLRELPSTMHVGGALPVGEADPTRSQSSAVVAPPAK